MYHANFQWIQSHFGILISKKFNSLKFCLSYETPLYQHIKGPAGGVVGYAMTSYSKEVNMPVIGFDMGGTSTDVSRYAGQMKMFFLDLISSAKFYIPRFLKNVNKLMYLYLYF